VAVTLETAHVAFVATQHLHRAFRLILSCDTCFAA
jgi:hypothetical protein